MPSRMRPCLIRCWVRRPINSRTLALGQKYHLDLQPIPCARSLTRLALRPERKTWYLFVKKAIFASGASSVGQ